MYLKINHISKTFGKEQVLQDLSFTLEAHRMLSILGRSGSGKTTLLKIIAGLEMPDSGTVELNGKTMNEVPAHLRNIVYLYQEPLLFPHLNAFENVAFGLRLRKLPETDIHQKTTEMLESLELGDQSKKMPGQLSGGQRQRVAFGRALIVEPQVLLLDEPFGALDTETRSAMQQLLKRMVATFKITTLFVTHDLKEALLMGDEMALMQGGILKKYETKAAFVQDARTGVGEEVAFWAALGIGN
ncbi:MAG: ABC transporter ATP-binding protein [Saprospiraceae bacterium]|nr:ABC transporter ATP-binding protein [Saprospiraceae bacterium]MCF8248705.1 ABC transporter ATP-binding protein [Saprospiraceae bacterium]MCF8278805.1 ABC transporter ATP-binding protein [Bacteroidales bacterium]MCF8310605.1 ABC transporter ATP-binding protein [Saprospiraceae bacterium]MCF8439164.1 ABC transporter ATP-binding protein [Saprospiraceae bacterium]